MAKSIVTAGEQVLFAAAADALCRTSGRSAHMHYDDLREAYNSARDRGLSHEAALALVHDVAHHSTANL